ncbi:Tex family protein [Amphritea sp. HPY]|uniref:Tex family protein n=1 Tax=Amphritea sp. HPY TaxID=3421652 RepID=UPI003D7D9F2B
MSDLSQQISAQLNIKTSQARATIALLDEGATVPFIARYRKEATGGLDDNQLRQLAEKLSYLRELNQRRQTIINSIRDQGLLNDTLLQALNSSDSKGRLEDLYLPYRPKRSSKAQTAKAAGLTPLADKLTKANAKPEQLARNFVNPKHQINTVDDALVGARHILMERFAEQADLLAELRDWLWRRGELSTKVIKGKQEQGAKFSDYFEFSEPVRRIPSHRALAIFRAAKEEIIRYKLRPLVEEADRPLQLIQRYFRLPLNHSAGGIWLSETVQQSWKQKLLPQLETNLLKQLKTAADNEAITVFSRNLKDLLLAPPAGMKATMGLDPGLRTGVKIAIVDNTGKVVDHGAIFPHPPKKQWDQSIQTLARLCRKHAVELISIGNGTASRETEKLVKELLQQHPELSLQPVVVSESGASIYSASEAASKELPDLDVTIRGAVSIARRLQDPLAELVKIEPKAIGVGQYQHDVDQNQLGQSLEHCVEDCVNHVGVDLNTASAELLTQISGLNSTSAGNIVAFRDQNGRFRNRKQLLKVPRLGPKAFQQSAGFLRINGGDNPLDNSAVHPEAYPLIEQIARHQNCAVTRLVGNKDQLSRLDPGHYISGQFGSYTVRDVLQELEKPGRDPRPEFRTAQFSDAVEKPSDLQPGMKLEGVVTNVTNFGAFVDIGVHQDGLVHISQLADRFIKDPHSIVKTGDIVRVTVQDVDLKRQRIALSMKQK